MFSGLFLLLWPLLSLNIKFINRWHSFSTCCTVLKIIEIKKSFKKSLHQRLSKYQVIFSKVEFWMYRSQFLFNLKTTQLFAFFNIYVTVEEVNWFIDGLKTHLKLISIKRISFRNYLHSKISNETTRTLISVCINWTFHC